jgi:outer membrane protein assembly factor BamE (lipoprotein component of BamABCDE complex)
MLLKNSSKRKRTKDELEDVKQEEVALKEDKHAFLRDVKRLKAEHAEMLAFLNNEQNQAQVNAGNGGMIQQ